MYEFGVEEVIAQVKIRRPLWDRSDKRNKNKDAVGAAWLDVSRKLCPGFDANESPAKVAIERAIKRIWKNARDTFVKNMRRGFAHKHRLDKTLSFLLKNYPDGCGIGAAEKELPLATPTVKRSRRRSSRLVEGSASSAAAAATATASAAAALRETVTVRRLKRHSDRLWSKRRKLLTEKAAPASCETVADAEFSGSYVDVGESGSTSQEESSSHRAAKSVACDGDETPATATTTAIATATSSSSTVLQSPPSPLPQNQIIRYGGSQPAAMAMASSFSGEDDVVRDSHFQQQNFRQPAKSSGSVSPDFTGNRPAFAATTATVGRSPFARIDADMCFFKSLLTWLTEFDDDEILEFRCEVIKLVQRIRKPCAKPFQDFYIIP